MNKNKRKLNKMKVVSRTRILPVPKKAALVEGVPAGNLYKCPSTSALLWVDPDLTLWYSDGRDTYISKGHNHWYGDHSMELVAYNIHDVDTLKVVLNELI